MANESERIGRSWLAGLWLSDQSDIAIAGDDSGEVAGFAVDFASKGGFGKARADRCGDFKTSDRFIERFGFVTML